MTPARHNPLAATPHVLPGVEARRQSDQSLRLRRPVPVREGWRGWLERRFGPRFVQVALDAQGTWFWQQIDGHRTLADIEAELRRKFSVPADQSRRAVLEFTQELMRRGLIGLQLPAGETPR